MEKKNIKGEIFDFLKDLVIIGIIVLLIRTFLAEPFQISGQSMYSSYYDKEFIIVDRFSYLNIPAIKNANINRGDVIVFKPGVSETKEYFLKRIIGLQGDTIKIKDGDVFLKKSGETEYVKLDEKYLNSENKGNTKIGNSKAENIFKVPKNKFFVMGDNRNHSSDSRTCFGSSCSFANRDSFITANDMTGKVFLDLGYFNRKEFNFTNPGAYDSAIKGIDTTPKWFNTPSTFSYE